MKRKIQFFVVVEKMTKNTTDIFINIYVLYACMGGVFMYKNVDENVQIDKIIETLRLICT